MKQIANTMIEDKPAPAVPVVEQGPVAWMQSNHFNQLVKRHPGSSMMLARCSDHKAMDDFVPLYPAPAVPEVEKLRDELSAYKAKAVIADMPLSQLEAQYREALEMARTALTHSRTYADVDSALAKIDEALK